MNTEFYVRADEQTESILSEYIDRPSAQDWFDMRVHRSPEGVKLTLREYVDKIPEAIKANKFKIVSVVLRSEHSTVRPVLGIYKSRTAEGHVDGYYTHRNRYQAAIIVRSRYLSSAVRLYNDILSRKAKPTIPWIEGSSVPQETPDYPDAEDFGVDSE